MFKVAVARIRDSETGVGVSLQGQHSVASAVDLYAGAGGLSLGLEMAGVAVRAAVEIDKWAADTHAENLPRTALFRMPVSELPAEFFQRFRGVDIVVGGPPCQGFRCRKGRMVD
jgi:DNA (cytosine-5)-methyltransferase 1